MGTKEDDKINAEIILLQGIMKRIKKEIRKRIRREISSSQVGD
jgi:hypothetical protein